MRVDTAAPAPTGYPAGSTYPVEFGDDTLTKAKRYLKALRRRWPAILVFTLVGGLVGWFTTPGEAGEGPLGPSTRYYQATHTLVGASSIIAPIEGGESEPLLNLSQASFYATAGEVPARVAERLGVEESTIEGRVSASPRSDVNSIAVTAIGTDPVFVVQLADTTANELVAFITEQAQQQYDEALASVLADIDELRAERERIQAEIAAGARNPDELDAELQSVLNRYAAAQQRFANISDVPDPTAGLSTLETAMATEITGSAFEVKEDRNILGPEFTPSTVAEGGGQASDEISEPAEPPDPVLRAALGAMVGLALAVGIVLGIDRFDTRLRRRDDVEAATNLPVLAEIPPLSRAQQQSTEVMASIHPRSRAAEAYRVVRSAIVFSAIAARSPESAPKAANGSSTPPLAANGGAPDIGHQVILVTSPGPAEGKTTVVANLAAVLAEGGLSVLVVNCDFRRPRVHRYLVGDSAPSTDIPLTSQDGSDLGQVRAMRTAIPNVRLITGIGEKDTEANPLEIVAVQRRIVQAARDHFDVVLLDTAPILTTNDASELLPECDQVLMVVRNGKTKAEAAHRTAEVLVRFDAPVLGVVFNGSDDTPAVQYYYNYYLDGAGKRVRSAGYVDPTPKPRSPNGGVQVTAEPSP